MKKTSYTYMLRCADDTLYTGWTNDLKKRLQVHNFGAGAKYTRVRRPVKLAYFEEFETKNEAMSREVRIKQLTRREKDELIQSLSSCMREQIDEINHSVFESGD